MRWRAIVLALVAWLSTGASFAVTAEAPDPADAAAIRSVIEGQLNAFMADNAPQAFSFMSMVRAGYQPVYRPQEVEFRDLVPVEGRWTQRVLVVGPDGVPVVAQYIMEKQPDGSWRIDACVFERSTEHTT